MPSAAAARRMIACIAFPLYFTRPPITQQEDQALGLDLGADRFLLKPQEPEVLIGIFQELLNKKRRAEAPVLASLEEEMEFLRRHNEALGRKLEKKILDLEAVYEQLRTQEETLRKEDEFLARVIENIPDMIFVKDAKTLNFVRFNRAGEKLLGVRREDMIGKNDYDFFPREQVDFFTAKDRETLAGKKLVDIRDESIETRDLERGSSIRRRSPSWMKRWEALYLLGISEDVTELRAAEKRWIARSMKTPSRASRTGSSSPRRRGPLSWPTPPWLETWAMRLRRN